jgi:hypothetical protein
MTMRETDQPTNPAPRTDALTRTGPAKRTDPGTRPDPDTTIDHAPSRRALDVGETKGSWKTTEFWAAIAGVAALIVIYNASDDLSLDLFRACLLATVLGAAYIVSRGLAKSGSRPERHEWREHQDGPRY